MHRGIAVSIVLLAAWPQVSQASEVRRATSPRRAAPHSSESTATGLDERPDIFAGFSHVDATDASLNGLELSASFPLQRRLRFAVDLARESGSFGAADLQQTNVMIGPALVWRHRQLRPFARLLLGAVHDRTTVDTAAGSVSDSATHLGLALVGGTDYMISRQWGARAQLGLWFVHASGESETDLHFSLGAVYRPSHQSHR